MQARVAARSLTAKKSLDEKSTLSAFVAASWIPERLAISLVEDAGSDEEDIVLSPHKRRHDETQDAPRQPKAGLCVLLVRTVSVASPINRTTDWCTAQAAPSAATPGSTHRCAPARISDRRTGTWRGAPVVFSPAASTRGAPSSRRRCGTRRRGRGGAPRDTAAPRPGAHQVP